ncbi:MAG: diguanylate cyclase response regulator [Geobacteraceae bacterium GWC2_53_11]|nr:MAG: diguanylate cyclase response regulator [Geobacteraceae bacterium GWC2_53_11]
MDTILLVEDDRFFREMFSNLLQAEGYQVETASCGSDGLEMLANGQYSLVITDLVMPDISGLEILSRVREDHPDVDVIMVTGNANLESAIFALKHGARDYLIKPVNPDEFKHSVAQCIQQRRLLDENQELKNMLALFRACQAIAGCLDREHLYHLLVEAIAREAGFSHALGFFMGAAAFELKVAKGITPDLGKSLLEVISSRLTDASELEFSIQHVDLSAQFAAEGFSSAFLIPVISGSTPTGMIVLLNSNTHSLPDIDAFRKNIHFLIDQSLNAFENAETYSQAKDLLFIDDVSGLYNHRYLDIALEREMKRVERYASHLAVLFIDVDSFKQVNDVHGHLVGSRVLAEFGALIKKSVRDVDIVIRYGGDEYTAILVETTCVTAELVAERIRRQVEAHHFTGTEGQVIRLTCSIGYACCPDDTASKDTLLEMADKAMYSGKTSGKNCVQRVQVVPDQD